jgi:hypothetical protein
VRIKLRMFKDLQGGEHADDHERLTEFSHRLTLHEVASRILRICLLCKCGFPPMLP